MTWKTRKLSFGSLSAIHPFGWTVFEDILGESSANNRFEGRPDYHWSLARKKKL
jgi:hypothetical protein